MSHTVKITTTTTTNSNALILNTGYLKTIPGLLKLGQLVCFVRVSKLYMYGSYIRSPFIDFGHRCCGHCQLLLSTICLHTCCARFILFADVGGIFDMHLLSAVGLCRFVEHRWPHFQNDVCEFHASSSINRHKFSWEYFHFIYARRNWFTMQLPQFYCWPHHWRCW